MSSTGLVYIVDDDEELCASLAWLLGSVHIDAQRFHDVGSFLAGYDPEQPACLVLDVRMPGRGGFELQEILNRAHSALPIVFVSAHGDVRMSVRALQRGAVDFLEKPYDPQHMLEVVQQALATAKERFARASRARELRTRLAALTPREREVLDLVMRGALSKNIASRLGISAKTVDVHRSGIRAKLGAESLVALARELTELDLDTGDGGVEDGQRRA
jgi:two-component system, LuxR family, response regulator FixJ